MASLMSAAQFDATAVSLGNNGYEFKGQSPVLVLDTNDIIDEYPDEKYAVNKGYQTEKEKRSAYPQQCIYQSSFHRKLP